MVSKAQQWHSMNPRSKLCFWNTLRWWMPSAITKMLSKTGQMTLHLPANVIFSRNFLLHGRPLTWAVNIGFWMEPSLDHYFLVPLAKWLVVLWTIRSSPTRKPWRSSLWMPSSHGANWMLSLAHQKDGLYNNLNPFGKIIKIRFLIILPLLPFDNSKNNFQNVSSIMKTNVPLHFEFFAHANISNALTRPSVILPFLLAPLKHQKFAYKLLCNICATNLKKTTHGRWERAKASLQVTFWPKGRNTMLQVAPSLGFSLHHSNRCWAP